MALSLKISEVSYDGLNHKVTIIDETGDYDAVTNVGGYGAPNADRSTLALVLSVRNTDGDNVGIAYVAPLISTSYEYTFTADGSYELNLVAVDYEAGAYNPTLMSLGRVFYSGLDDKVYKVVDTNGVNTVEETIDVYATGNEVNVSLFYLVQSFTETRLIDIFCASCDCGGLKEEYNHLRETLDAINCSFNKAQYTDVGNLFNFASKIVI